MESQINNLDEQEFAKASEVSVNGVDVRGYVFVIPVDAPVPSEVASARIETGSLYKRLMPLADEAESETFSFVPLSGAELLALERAWRGLQTVKKVGVLTDLPGARYDVLFTQATRQIGLPKFEWTQVADGLSAKLVSQQRLKDTKPWTGLDASTGAPRAPKAPGHNRSVGASIPEPAADDEDEELDE